jgi:hypothetical protein
MANACKQVDEEFNRALSAPIEDDPIVMAYKRYPNWIYGRINDVDSSVVVKEICQAIVEHCKRKGVVV